MPQPITFATVQQRLQAIQEATAALAADVDAAMRREAAQPTRGRRSADPYNHFRLREMTGQYKPTKLKKQIK